MPPKCQIVQTMFLEGAKHTYDIFFGAGKVENTKRMTLHNQGNYKLLILTILTAFDNRAWALGHFSLQETKNA